MSLFSQRKGLKPLQKVTQLEHVDEELRNQLWNSLIGGIWNLWKPLGDIGRISGGTEEVEKLVNKIWTDYFKRPLDTRPDFYNKAYYVMGDDAYHDMRTYFFNCNWNEVFDFIEFVYKNFNCTEQQKKDLKERINKSLETENSAYRLVGSEIVEISNKHEIESIETTCNNEINCVSEHINTALAMLSDKKSPDYRNSIKESISAVEALCRLIVGKDKATLSDCIKEIDNWEKSSIMHPAIKDALSKLYGYTSDAGGIRHALTEDSLAPSYADAKFMLVSCSAFCNYMLTKASELNINI